MRVEAVAVAAKRAAAPAHVALRAFPQWRGCRLVAALSQGMYWLLVLRADLPASPGDVNAVKGRTIGAAPMVELGLRQLLIDSVGSWIIVASAVIVVLYIAGGWLVGRLRDAETAVTISCVSSFRFTPIGLVVIATVLNNDGAYLIPALIYSLVDTIIPLVAGIEFGRAADKGAKQETTEAAPVAAAATPSGTA